jgi:DNA polymerase (family X)
MNRPRPVGNDAIAEHLERVARLLDLDGANAFRVRAYRNAAETVAAHPEPIAAMVARGADLTALKGVGRDIAAGIAELVRAGRLPQLEALAERVPLGLLVVVQVPGVGSKRARTLWQQLGVTDLDTLEREARSGRIAALPGFGVASQAKILSGIAGVRQRAARVRLGDVEPRAQALVEALRAAGGVQRAGLAGSIRRGCETVRDIDLVACADDPEAPVRALRDAHLVREVLTSGEREATALLGDGLQVDLRVVPQASFGAALVHCTGSKGHNLALRQRATQRDLRLSEYGIERPDGTALPAAEEAEVYTALGLSWIPPELREGRGEIEATEAGRLPALIELGDVRGDLHWHTTWSDGLDTVEAMLQGCAARGYAYAAITDHSQALRMAGGLDDAKLARQHEALDALDEARARAGEAEPVLLRGLEVDIRRDGTLDVGEAWLARLDLVIVSVHSHFGLPRAEQTARMVRAVQQPHVNVLAHPSGRVLGRRDAYDVDLDAVFAAAAEAGVAVECNAAPSRLDAGDADLMRAVRAGCTVVINTDAHSLKGLGDMRYGVLTARRAWLTSRQVLNCWPFEKLRTFLGRAS